ESYSRTDHSSEVLRVFNLVEREHQALAFLHSFEEDVDFDKAEIGCVSNRALMSSAFRRAIEIRARDPLDRRSAIAGEPCDGLDLWAATRFHEHALESIPMHPNRFPDGLKPGNESCHRAIGSASRCRAFRARMLASAMSRAAATRSTASRIGLPITIQSAPA